MPSFPIFSLKNLIKITIDNIDDFWRISIGKLDPSIIFMVMKYQVRQSIPIQIKAQTSYQIIMIKKVFSKKNQKYLKIQWACTCLLK